VIYEFFFFARTVFNGGRIQMGQKLYGQYGTPWAFS
jgi:hypothetical protein